MGTISKALKKFQHSVESEHNTADSIYNETLSRSDSKDKTNNTIGNIYKNSSFVVEAGIKVISNEAEKSLFPEEYQQKIL